MAGFLLRKKLCNWLRCTQDRQLLVTPGDALRLDLCSPKVGYVVDGRQGWLTGHCTQATRQLLRPRHMSPASCSRRCRSAKRKEGVEGGQGA